MFRLSPHEVLARNPLSGVSAFPLVRSRRQSMGRTPYHSVSAFPTARKSQTAQLGAPPLGLLPMTSVALPVASGRPLWRVAQIFGVVLTLALIAALWIVPKPSLKLLWDMVIPLLPAAFLVNPLIWRNVCPLATLNDLSGDRAVRRTMPSGMTHAGWIVGIVLLFVLVPARRFLFNENGPALAITVTLVAVLAVVTGLIFARRTGFCNTLCPVLPVEKLYGQVPLMSMHGARCDSCTVCTPVGCIDLAATKTLAQTIGPLRRDTGWLRTGFGVFAAAFPGFILGYFNTTNGDLSTAAAVYLSVLGFAAASYVVVAAITTALHLRATLLMPLLGATALGIYYWYAAPKLTEAYAAPDATTLVLRIVIGATLAFWLWKVLPRALNGKGAALAT